MADRSRAAAAPASASWLHALLGFDEVLLRRTSARLVGGRRVAGVAAAPVDIEFGLRRCRRGAIIPAMGLRATSPVLVGRRDELGRLAGAAEVAVSGESAVVLVAGEAGVGKSRLVDELAAQAGDRGLQVAIGRCIEFGETIWPMAPLREILARLAVELDAESLEGVLGGARDVLGQLVPELGEWRSERTGVVAERLGELVVGVVERLARRQPLLLVFEDLHWADASTRSLFSLLARVGGLGPVLLVGTYRSDELHRRHPLRPLLAELARSSRTARSTSTRSTWRRRPNWWPRWAAIRLGLTGSIAVARGTRSMSRSWWRHDWRV